MHSTLTRNVQLHLSLHPQSSLTWTRDLTASLSLAHLWFQHFNTLFSSILNFEFINHKFLRITEWNPSIPMFRIVLTTTLSDFIAIFKNLMHLLENYNSISIHPAKCGRSTQYVVHGTRHTPSTAIRHVV